VVLVGEANEGSEDEWNESSGGEKAGLLAFARSPGRLLTVRDAWARRTHLE
jgi:hypothetical protein